MDNFNPTDPLIYDWNNIGALEALEIRIRTLLGSHRKGQEGEQS